MKFPTKSILAAGALLALDILPIPAQQAAGGLGFVTIAPPGVQHLLTNSAAGIPFVAVGGGTAPGPSTNLANLACVVPFLIGARGYAIQINCAGTNATTTTNVTFFIEYSLNGIDYATNNTTQWVVGPLGTQYAPVSTNNPQTDVTGIMGNYAYGRLRNIHHTNTGSIFITNLFVTTR